MNEHPVSADKLTERAEFEAFLPRLEAVAGDASRRSYYRIPGQNKLIMDCGMEPDTLPSFIRTGGILDVLGINVPHIYKANTASGLAVIEDFGARRFGLLLESGSTPPQELYKLAVDVLIRIHKNYIYDAAAYEDLPRYDAALLGEQAALVTETLLPALGRDMPPKEAIAAFIALWEDVLAPLCDDAPTLMLRDYHADNLILVPGAEGLDRCGVIDFQDAGPGPLPYDLVSLLQDARRDIKPALENDMLDYYLTHFPTLDRADFLRDYRIIAAQRHIRILAVFTRLGLAMGKPRYLAFMPRVWSQFMTSLQEPALAPIRDWLNIWLGPENFGRVPMP